MFRPRAALLALLLAAPLASAPAGAQTPPTAEPSIEELLQSTDDVTRGESSVAVIEMHVKTNRYERTMRMQSWSQGTERTLIRILEPAKDAGIATLKVDDNMWNYLPKVDRTIKVPAGMMGGNWMGSHFSNDDLVKENRLSEDFVAALTGRPADTPEGVYVISLTPKPETPVVWGQIIAKVRPDRMPVEIVYLDEEMAPVRTMSFSDYRDFDGRMAPAVMTLVPADSPEEFTKVTYISLDFHTEIPASTFTLQGLR
ncbi:MAG: outer membrane lipoprotein-sorting protein [Deltaproteobacteria bacterium]|nr:outer membrane lipoprotein-sorting protein [Deltaproteobacteria bacterium]